MLVYTINLIFTTVLNYLSRIIKHKKISSALIGLALLFASSVAGLRYGVGTDFFAYEQWFRHYLAYPIRFDNYQDLGFSVMIKGLQLFTDSPQILFFVSALITNILVMMFIKKNTDLYDLGFFLFITLYFYYSSLNIMRQWIAISIFLFSLKYAFDKKFIKYILLVLIASTFHASALLMLPIYFTFRFKAKFTNIFVLFIISFLIAFNFNTIVIKLANFFPFLNAERYLSYFDSSFATSGGGGWAYSIILIATFILMLFCKNKYELNIKYGDKHFILLIFATVFSFFAPSSMIFSRLQLFLMPIAIICIPNLVKIQKPKERVLITVIIILLGVLYMYRTLLINGGEPLPYESVLFK